MLLTSISFSMTRCTVSRLPFPALVFGSRALWVRTSFQKLNCSHQTSFGKGLTLTPDQLRDALALLGWSQRGFARILQRDEGTVRQWARGALTIPSDVALWLDGLAGYFRQNPPPGR